MNHICQWKHCNQSLVLFKSHLQSKCRPSSSLQHHIVSQLMRSCADWCKALTSIAADGCVSCSRYASFTFFTLIILIFNGIAEMSIAIEKLPIFVKQVTLSLLLCLPEEGKVQIILANARSFVPGPAYGHI